MITLKPEFASMANRVAKELSEKGLLVERVYPFGVIAGRVDIQLLNSLKNHEGVENIAQEQITRIAPPNDPIQ